MSTYWPGNMRGLPVVKTPLLLLLLLLLSTLTGTVLCENGDDGSAEDTATQVTTTGDYQLPPDTVDDAVDSGDSTPSTTETTLPSALDTTEETSSDYLDTGSAEGPSVSTPPPEEEGLSPIIILIPVVLVVVIIGMIVCGIFINRRLNKSTRSQELRKEDPYLDGPSTEKVPMPMFEEDVPSVLELEMEELDEWMKKDGKSTEDSAHA